nr:hypothetical protein [Tanacetum cinerariifolium]
MDTTIEQQVDIEQQQMCQKSICRNSGQQLLSIIMLSDSSAAIRTLTDVNINKLYQSQRSFAAIINKCLTGKSSGYDSLRLSKAQIMWGLYHKRNVDYAYLMWKDFVYQVEHKNQKKSDVVFLRTYIISKLIQAKSLSIFSNRVERLGFC